MVGARGAACGGVRAPHLATGMGADRARQARPMVEFMVDSTRSVVDFVLAGAFARPPNLRVLVPHSGAMLPLLSDRIALFQQGFGLGADAAPCSVCGSTRPARRSRTPSRCSRRSRARGLSSTAATPAGPLSLRSTPSWGPSTMPSSGRSRRLVGAHHPERESSAGAVRRRLELSRRAGSTAISSDVLSYDGRRSRSPRRAVGRSCPGVRP